MSSLTPLLSLRSAVMRCHSPRAVFPWKWGNHFDLAAEILYSAFFYACGRKRWFFAGWRCFGHADQWTCKENLPQAEQSDPNEIIINGIYRHFKGNLYKVIALATHSEEEKPYVIYRQMYGDFALWVRPLDMFLETIERDGMRFKRFQFLFRQNEADQLTK